MRTFSQKSAGVCSFVKSMYMYNMEAEYPKQFRDEINWIFLLIILTSEVCFCVDSFLTYKIVVIYFDYFCLWKYTNSTRVKKKSVYFFEIIGLYKNDSVVAKKIVPNSIKNYVFSGVKKFNQKKQKTQ